MNLIDYIPQTPEDAIAFDESLLMKAESGELEESYGFGK